MIGRRRPYLSYLLRLWLVEDDGLVWRASLENPRTAERHGFAALEDLVAFLLAETRDRATDEQWRSGETTTRALDRLAEGPARRERSGDDRTEAEQTDDRSR